MKTLTIDVAEVLRFPCKRRKFYRWLSSQFDGAIIIECGTAIGATTKDWASNPSNFVITYDIDTTHAGYAISREELDRMPNVVWKMFDVNELDPQWFSNVNIIFVDISHNGWDEERFLNLIEPHFKGILVMDDVDWEDRFPVLYMLFNRLEREHHLLPESIGASRGTGVVAYGDWTIMIKEVDHA